MDYLHPSTSTKITDNSYVAQTAQGQTALFQAYFSARGVDNVLTEYNSESEFRQANGDPDLGKYGQAGYNITNWLINGGKCYGLRLLPTDARYANIKLSATIENTGGSTFVTVNTAADKTSTVSKDAMELALSQVVGPLTAPTVTVPIGYFFPKGRGADYNGLGVRISLRDDRDNDYEFRTYNMYFTEKDSTGIDAVIDGPFLVSFSPTAKSRNTTESLYYAYVINKYSTILQVMDNRDAFDDISSYITSKSANPNQNPDQVDIIFGTERNTITPVPKIHDGVKWKSKSLPIADPAYSATAPDMNAIQYLGGGFEGNFTGGQSQASLLVKAYRGLIDPAVTDKLAFEIDVLLDANFDVAVKNAMDEFVSSIREDCVAMVDCGFQANPQQTIDFRRNSVNMSSRYTSVWGQHFMVFDAFTGQSIQVTTPYYLASKIPAVDIQFGLQYPFVGPRRGVINGFESINFIPNEGWKENLYRAQVNYVEHDPKRYNFGTQLTSQVQSSALSDINNVRALVRIRREVEKMLSEYRFEFNDSITHDSMSYNLNSYLQTWIGNRTCSTISGKIYASAYDRQQKIVRAKIELVFTGIIERVMIDINVNR